MNKSHVIQQELVTDKVSFMWYKGGNLQAYLLWFFEDDKGIIVSWQIKTQISGLTFQDGFWIVMITEELLGHDEEANQVQSPMPACLQWKTAAVNLVSLAVPPTFPAREKCDTK